ncbi:hypothetical protein ACHAXS_012167 [Conticribra weissflogii]
MKSVTVLLLSILPLIRCFSPCNHKAGTAIQKFTLPHSFTVATTPYTAPSSLFKSSALEAKKQIAPQKKITQQRRKQLGIADDEDEYDLDFALDNNTDAGITKIIAGSFILVMIALLVVGLVIPSITDYGDGVCSPIQNGGRC